MKHIHLARHIARGKPARIQVITAALRPVVAAMLVAGLASPANAIDTVWFGGSGTWDTALNWSSGIPGVGDVAVINAGTATLNFGTAIAGFEQSGGSLSGTGTLTVSGLSTLTGGEQTGAGVSQFNGNVDISGNNDRFLSGGRSMNTAGITTWSGNSINNGNEIRFNGSATISNSGTWNDANAFDSTLGTGLSGTKVFNNSGSYNKNGNAVTDINAAFSNTGTVNVNAGRLALNGNIGSVSTGTFNIAAGSVLSFGDGGSSAGLATLDNVTFGGTGTVLIDATNLSGSDVRLIGVSSHAGQLAIANGTLQIDGSFSVQSYAQSGGDLAGTGTLTVAGLSTLTGGEQTGAGVSQFNGNVDISGNNDRFLSGGRTMNTAGITTWSGNSINNGNEIRFNGSATISNSGTWNDANAFDSTLGTGLSGTKVFNNGGVYNKNGNAVTDINTAFNNSGTVNVNAGTLNVTTSFTNDGLIKTAAGATFLGSNATFINAGTLAGDGTYATHVNGDIANRGAIHPGDAGVVGALTFEGDLDLDEATPGSLNIDLAGILSFDTIDISGDVTLGGELAIWSVGGYNPALGDSFVIATFGGTQVGGLVFDSVSWHGFSPALAFDVVYNPNDVTLTVAAVPEPETYAMLLAGLGLVGFAARRRTRLPA